MTKEFTLVQDRAQIVTEIEAERDQAIADLAADGWYLVSKGHQYLLAYNKTLHYAHFIRLRPKRSSYKRLTDATKKVCRDAFERTSQKDADGVWQRGTHVAHFPGFNRQ